MIRIPRPRWRIVLVHSATGTQTPVHGTWWTRTGAAVDAGILHADLDMNHHLIVKKAPR